MAYLGVGLGYRPIFYDDLRNKSIHVDWLEIIVEDYLNIGGTKWRQLSAIAEQYPVVLHSLSLSIAGSEPLDKTYITQLKQLQQDLSARWISDHLSWSSILGRQTYELLPFPRTRETLLSICQRINRVQDIIGGSILLENTSAYMEYQNNEMTEAHFFYELCTRTGCRMLLDISNLYISAHNLAFDPWHYVQALPLAAITQIHLAGYSRRGRYLIDTHDSEVSAEVLTLYKRVLALLGRPVTTMLEWDDCMPSLDQLSTQLCNIRASIESINVNRREQPATRIDGTDYTTSSSGSPYS